VDARIIKLLNVICQVPKPRIIFWILIWVARFLTQGKEPRIVKLLNVICQVPNPRIIFWILIWVARFLTQGSLLLA